MSEVEASAVQSILARLTQLQWPDVAPNPYNLAGALRAALITLHEGTSGCADSCVARLLTFASDPDCLYGDGLEPYLERRHFAEDNPGRAEELRQGAPLTPEERSMILDAFWHSEDCFRASPVYYVYRITLPPGANAGFTAYFIAESHELPNHWALNGVFGPFRALDAVCDALFDDPSSPLTSARGVSQVDMLEAQESFGEVLQRRGDVAVSRAAP